MLLRAVLKDMLRRALGIKEEEGEKEEEEEGGGGKRNEAKQDLGFSLTKTATVLFFSNLEKEQFSKERLAKKGNSQAL